MDLVVSATGTGFGEVFVVKNRVAAANPALRQLAFGSTSAGLRWQHENGQLKAVDERGKAVLTSSAPRMWDASGRSGGYRAGEGGRARGDVSGPAEGARLRNSNDGGSPDYTFAYGTIGDIPVVGDWNGDGIDTVGIWRPGSAMFMLRNSNSNSNSGGSADYTFAYGTIGDRPVLGNWNGDGQ